MLRTFQWRCLPRAAVPNGVLVQIQLPLRGYQPIRAVVPQARGSRSLGNIPKPPQDGRPRKPPKPPVTFRQFMRAVFAHLRNPFKSMRQIGPRELFRQNPGEMTLAVISLFVLGGTLVYAVVSYFTYFNAPHFTNFPDPVAKSLRRALYYSNITPDHKRAIKYYTMALEQCAEHGMDPFSDDVIGLRIQISAWLQKIGSFDNAIKVLESLLEDLQGWVDVFERADREGRVGADGRTVEEVRGTAKKIPEQQGAARDGEKAEVQTEKVEVKFENLWHKRTRLLAKATGIAVKIGELYASEYVLEPEKGADSLTWAVEIALREHKRRVEKGPRPGEGPWMSAEEIGGAMEALAHNYEAKSQFQLALPLFLQCLPLSKHPCHTAVIMNNISACFAQYPLLFPPDAILTEVLTAADNPVKVPSSAAALVSPELQSQARLALQEAALRWADNAGRLAKEPPLAEDQERTEECGEACAVAAGNKALVLAMMGRLQDAGMAVARMEKISEKEGVGKKTGRRLGEIGSQVREMERKALAVAEGS